MRTREGCEEPYIEFYVDGEDLGRRVKVALGEAGFDDVLPWYGGDYTLEETVLGEQARAVGAEGAILFACGCGYYACSGVSATVVVSGETLTLRDIFTWRGGQRVVAPVEPITFDRRQFEDAVRQLEQDVAAWRPPAKPDRPSRAALIPPSPSSPAPAPPRTTSTAG